MREPSSASLQQAQSLMVVRLSWFGRVVHRHRFREGVLDDGELRSSAGCSRTTVALVHEAY